MQNSFLFPLCWVWFVINQGLHLFILHWCPWLDCTPQDYSHFSFLIQLVRAACRRHVRTLKKTRRELKLKLIWNNSVARQVWYNIKMNLQEVFCWRTLKNTFFKLKTENLTLLFVCLLLPDVVGEVPSHSKYGKILLELKTKIYNEFSEMFWRMGFWYLLPCLGMNTDRGAHTQFYAS